jgi:hypothetical protein
MDNSLCGKEALPAVLVAWRRLQLHGPVNIGSGNTMNGFASAKFHDHLIKAGACHGCNPLSCRSASE